MTGAFINLKREQWEYPDLSTEENYVNYKKQQQPTNKQTKNPKNTDLMKGPKMAAI